MERGIAAFVICASLIRQFEFAQNVWANDRKLSTNSAMNAIRSSATRTVHSNLKFPSVQSARKSSDCRPSPP